VNTLPDIRAQVNALPDIPHVLDRRPLIWSFSMLKAFRDICPHQGAARYIRRSVQFVETPEIKWGNAVHTAFEHRVGGGRPLPQDMQQWECFAAPLDKFEGKLVEQKYGVTSEGRPCEFFAKDVWGRGKLDVVIVRDDSAYLPDWKTGNSRYEDPFELRVNAALLHARMPRLKRIMGQYVWLKDNRLGEMYDLSDTAATWKEIGEIVTTIHNWRTIDDYPKRQSPLCGWCPVTECEHHP
jgi:hypothetical protein